MASSECVYDDGVTPFYMAFLRGNENVVAYLAERVEEVDVFEVEGEGVSEEEEYLRDVWQLHV